MKMECQFECVSAEMKVLKGVKDSVKFNRKELK